MAFIQPFFEPSYSQGSTNRFDLDGRWWRSDDDGLNGRSVYPGLKLLLTGRGRLGILLPSPQATKISIATKARVCDLKWPLNGLEWPFYVGTCQKLEKRSRFLAKHDFLVIFWNNDTWLANAKFQVSNIGAKSITWSWPVAKTTGAIAIDYSQVARHYWRFNSIWSADRSTTIYSVSQKDNKKTWRWVEGQNWRYLKISW